MPEDGRARSGGDATEQRSGQVSEHVLPVEPHFTQRGHELGRRGLRGALEALHGRA